jgi:hypothetical protein
VIETVAALVALMTSIQLAMLDADHAWPPGRSWALPIKYTLSDAVLEANKAPCCYYLTQPGSSIILRVNDTVYLLKH